MVDWDDPGVIGQAAEFYKKFMMFLLGLYFWELFTTFDFELSFIGRPSRRRKWRSHYIPYFACRYSFLVALVLINVTLNVTHEVPCQSLFIANQFFGNIAIGTASLNLLLRTYAVWLALPSIVYPLGFLAIVHWVILLYNSTTLKAYWDYNLGACIYSGLKDEWILALYAYTMAFDFIILVCCFIRLRWRPLADPRNGGIWNLIWRDGVVYFITAFLANALPVIFLVLDLNQPMNFMFSIPASAACSIVSCRAVVRLTAYGPRDPTNANSTSGSYSLTPAARPYGSARFRFDIKNGKRKDPTGLSKRSVTESKQIKGGLFDVDPTATLPSAIYAKTMSGDDHDQPIHQTQSVDDYGQPTARIPAAQLISVGSSSGDSAPSTPIPWTNKKTIAAPPSTTPRRSTSLERGNPDVNDVDPVSATREQDQRQQFDSRIDIETSNTRSSTDLDAARKAT